MAGQVVFERAAAHAAIVREGYEAFARGDLAAASSSFDPAITWRFYGTGRIAGEYKGIDQVQEFLKQLVVLSGGTFRMELIDILASDDEAAVNVRAHAQRLGRTYASHQVHLFRFRDERVVEVWQFASDTNESAAFWE